MAGRVQLTWFGPSLAPFTFSSADPALIDLIMG
jgi:hypothetical protein